MIKYYKTWQGAFLDFISKYGSNFEDPYNLTAEFELQLKQNVRGAYFIYHKGEQ